MPMTTNWSIEGKNHERNFKSVMFLGLLWLSLFVAFLFLTILLVTTAMNGMGRYDLRLFTDYNNTTPVDAGARAAILGSLFVVTVTALMAPRRFNQTAWVAITSTAQEARPKSCRMAWVGITCMGVRVK